MGEVDQNCSRMEVVRRRRTIKRRYRKKKIWEKMKNSYTCAVISTFLLILWTLTSLASADFTHGYGEDFNHSDVKDEQPHRVPYITAVESHSQAHKHEFCKKAVGVGEGYDSCMVKSLPERPSIGFETLSPMDSPADFPQDCKHVPVVKLRKGNCSETRMECRNDDPTGGPLGCKEVCEKTFNENHKLPALVKMMERQDHCEPCDRHFQRCYEKHCKFVRQNTCAKPLAPQLGWKPVKTCTKTISRECAIRMKDICQKEGLSMAECASIICNEDPIEHCTWNPVAVYKDHHEPLDCGPEGATICSDEWALDRCIKKVPEGCGEHSSPCANFMTTIQARLSFKSCKLKCRVTPVCSKVPDISCYEVVLEDQC